MDDEPRPAWSVIGHDEAVNRLARAVETGQVGHAYLIAGPDGVGRSTLALSFARALLCTAMADSRPCGICSACRRVERRIHPDLTIVGLEGQASRVSIDAIRELRSSISLRPLEAEWRVAILEDVDFFSRDAYDALLKTLEEPPPFVVLLLIATDVEALPETIVSRCRVLTLEPVPRATVIATLRERGLEPELAATIASLARGRIGTALTMAADPDLLATRRESLEDALRMIESPLAGLAGARRLAESFRRGRRDRVEAELNLLLGLWRDILLAATGCQDQIVNADASHRIVALGTRWRLDEIQRGLKATYEALTDLSLNVQPRLALDRMVTQWPRPNGH